MHPVYGIIFNAMENIKSKKNTRKIYALALAVLLSALTITASTDFAFAKDENPSEIRMGNTVRVGLKYDSSAVESFSLSCDGGFSIAEFSRNGDMTVLQNTSATEITVSAVDGAVSIIDASDGTVLLSDMSTQNVIVPRFYSEGYVLAMNKTSYRGGFSYTLTAAGKMNVINVLSVEQYLYGVVPSEIGASAPLEAQKAQAVAARSFTVQTIEKGGRHGSSGFDVCSGTHCQVYRAYAGEKELSSRAVDETAGECIWYEGKVVDAYYAKNSGGYTQNSEDVWSAKTGYLRGKPDPYGELYKWEKTYTFSEIENILDSAGKSVGTLEKVEITKRLANYNVKELTFTGSAGTAKVTGEGVRSLFGAGNVKSTMFAFDGSAIYVTVDENGKLLGESGPAAGETPAASLKGKYVYSAGGFSSIASETAFAIGESGQTTSLPEDRIYAVSASGTAALISEGRKKEAVSDTAFSPAGASKNSDGTYTIPRISGSDVVTSGNVRFTGLGYGHGIGMQQDGAIAMAKQGFSYTDILKFYFTDIEVK